ncbi:hypothetical protein ACG7TL_005907 [Trametes sanguinea]
MTMGSESLQGLAALTGEAMADTFEDDIQRTLTAEDIGPDDDDDDEWEDVPDSDEVTAITYAIRDILQERATERTRQPSEHVPESSEQAAASSEYDFEIEVLDFFTRQHKAYIKRSPDQSTAEALVAHGFLGTTPISPSIAISLETLELMRCIRLFKASFSTEAFTKMLCYRYYLEGEDPAEWDRFLCVDGNNSLKRLAALLGRGPGDPRTFLSNYMIPRDFVASFANEVKSRQQQSKPDLRVDDDDTDVPDAQQSGGETFEISEGDPTDGVPEGGTPCATNWKAAAADAQKRMWGVFDETGIVACCCRHGLVLYIVDMVRSGELAKYVIAIVAKIMETIGGRNLFGYDIGCTFKVTILHSSLGEAFRASGSRFCVNAFHGYSHAYHCQVQNHPNTIKGAGLEDFETLERLFSDSNELAPVTRYASPYRRHVLMDMFFTHHDDEKYANLGLMIYNNYVQALEIITDQSPVLDEAMRSLGITADDLRSFRSEEHQYFSTLQDENPANIHAVAYVEALQELRQVSDEFHAVSRRFYDHAAASAGQSGAPLTFMEPIAGPTDYDADLSATRKLETRRRYLRERMEQLTAEVNAMEVRMEINNRWQPGDAQYREVVQYIAERRYHRALGKLQRLVIQRLFELHRMNLSRTGYKTRTYIAKSLQTRCKAIRNAVNAYNEAARALNPPRETLDWSKASHYAFLEEFELLRDTTNDIRQKKWAQPVVRETMRLAQRVERAHDEINNVNREISRLHASIRDEESLFTAVLEDLEKRDTSLHGAVQDYESACQAFAKGPLSQLSFVHCNWKLSSMLRVQLYREMTPGIFEKQRPPQIALGDFKPLLPIVIACAEEQDAHAIFDLDFEVFESTSELDNHRLIYMLQQPPATDIVLKKNSPIYCVRVGIETGIWVGFSWYVPTLDMIGHNVSRFKPKEKAQWCRATSISEALVYMLKKPGYTLPLLPDGVPVPPPPSSPEPVRPPSSPQAGPPPVTPAKTRTRTDRNAATISGSSSKIRTPAATPVRAGMAPSLAASASSIKGGAPAKPEPDFPDLSQDLAAALAKGLQIDAITTVLRRLVRRPTTMEEQPESLLPITFGPAADALLVNAGVTTADLLTLLQRLSRESRKNSTIKRTRMPWTTREDRARRARRIKLSTAEKRALREKRAAQKSKLHAALQRAREAMWQMAVEMKEEFGAHDTDYYYRLIMQTSKHASSQSRKISLWNAFVSKEMKKFNDEHIKELSRRWKQMSKEEREEAGGDVLKELDDRRQNRQEGIHNVPLHAFNDVSANVASIRRQLENLNGRTGTDFLLLAVRSQADHFNPPYFFYTNDRILQFMELLNNMPLQEFAWRLEGYCISGVDSLKKSGADTYIELKQKVKTVILDKLQSACTRGNIKKMFYVGFAERITLRYGVVLERWPLPKFVAPGSLSSRQELLVLLHAFENDVACFRQLTNEEWEEWIEKYRAGGDSTVPALPSPSTAAASNDAVAMPSTEAGDSPPTPTPLPTTPELDGTAADPPQHDLPTPDCTTTIHATGDTPSAGRKRAAEGACSLNFLYAVTNESGNGIVVPKRARKERSDKGKPREKRAKGRNTAQARPAASSSIGPSALTSAFPASTSAVPASTFSLPASTPPVPASTTSTPASTTSAPVSTTSAPASPSALPTSTSASLASTTA